VLDGDQRVHPVTVNTVTFRVTGDAVTFGSRETL
jgi:hypothetical protein